MQNITPVVSTLNNSKIDEVSTGYPHEKLRDALMYAQDCLDRASMPYFVWGNTLEHIINNEEELTGDSEITLAIKESELVPGNVSILEHWAGKLKKGKDTISFSHGDIPIVIHIIKGDYRFLDNAEMKYYWIENFWVPNPISEYKKLYPNIV